MRIFSVISIALLAVSSPGICVNTDDHPNVTPAKPILNGKPSDSQQNQHTVSKPEHADYDFSYREFVRNRCNVGPSRTLRHSGRCDSPRRDLEVEIDFDDHDVGRSWATIEVLHDFYEDLGVNFRGENDSDGGGVINEAGNFGVNGHSSPNFLAFNTGGRYPNGGTARPPQFIIFDTPVDVVTINAGARGGGGITMTAFDADDDEIADTELDMQAQMQEMPIERGGIAYVVIETGVNVFVLDDLYFASLAELEISPESFDLVVPVEQEIVETLTVRNVGEGDLNFEIEILGDGPDWLSCNPVEGTVEPDEEIEIEVTINTEDMEPGEYDRVILFNSNDPDRPELEIPVHIFAVRGSGQLYGVVTDAADEEPLEGVHLRLDAFDYETDSDADGEFDFGDLPAWSYTLIATIEDYLPYVDDNVEVEVDEETSLEIGILHSTCEPDPEQIRISLEPDQETEMELTISNRGNGSLTWTVERTLPEEVEIDPWEQRGIQNVENVVNDDMLNGVVFAEGHYFVAGGNNGDDVNKIYVLNTDYELEDEFDQFSESRYGMRDLAYDGNLIWGADDGTFYGFTTDCELETSFESPVNMEGRSIAWDPDNRVLLASDIATDIFAIDLEGDLVETFERPAELRVYGLGYWQDDPDGYNLYVFCRGDSSDLQVNKINLDNGDFRVAAEINVDGGRPGGIQITNQYDPYSWVFMAVTQNPDRLAVWQLATNREWFRIDMEEGVIEADESEVMVLTLDAAGIEPEVSLEGDLVFTHDGVGGETIVPVRLDVEEGEVHAIHHIPLNIGWNLVSSYVQPDDHENIRGLMAELVEDDLLIILKNGNGQFYSPAYDYNNIPGWYVDEGYQILVRGECVLRLEGMSVVQDHPIQLREGWQIVSYLPRFPVDAVIALSGIVDHLIIAKDGRGNFYLPDWDFSNMGEMQRGQGYYLNVDADCELIYQIEEDDRIGSAGQRYESVYDTPGSLPVHAVTGENMSLLVVESIPPLLLQGGSKGGSEIGIFAGGQLVGSGVLQDGVCGIAVWGDDPMTDKIDGALEGQELEIRLVDENGSYQTDFEILCGKSVYQTNSFCVVKLNSTTEIPSEFGIVDVYPNPFNSTTRITYSLPAAAMVELKLFDLTGREVVTLINDSKQPGTHTTTLTASNLPAGLYLVRMKDEGGRMNQTRKIVLVK